MEQAISGKSEGLVIQAVQALLPAFINHWEDHRAFRHAGTPLFMREAGFAREEMARAVVVVDHAFRQVPILYVRQFRALSDREQLENHYTRLVPSASDSPVRQGFLWLAFQLQAAAIDFFESEIGQQAMEPMQKAVDDNKVVFQALQTEADNLTIAKIERILAALAQKTLGEEKTKFQIMACVGSLLEFARREARQLPGRDLLTDSRDIPPEQVRLLAVIVEPVHAAELNEASHRFFRLRDQEKAHWFDNLRAFLDKKGEELARFAPMGFERFSEAVEAIMFPYPGQLEWMRAYLKPLFTNAMQSSVFDNCLTEASIAQRFEKLSGEKSANRFMIVLARAFALAKLNKLREPGQDEFIESLDFQNEFHWPATLAELKAHLKP